MHYAHKWFIALEIYAHATLKSFCNSRGAVGHRQQEGDTQPHCLQQQNENPLRPVEHHILNRAPPVDLLKVSDKTHDISSLSTMFTVLICLYFKTLITLTMLKCELESSQIQMLAHLTWWDLSVGWEHLHQWQGEVRESQTLKHSRYPKPGQGHLICKNRHTL